MFLDRLHAPVYVGNIRNSLEGIKGNANRQRNIPGCEALLSQNGIDKLQEEIKVFEISQKAQIGPDANGQRCPPKALPAPSPSNCKAKEVIEQDG